MDRGWYFRNVEVAITVSEYFTNGILKESLCNYLINYLCEKLLDMCTLPYVEYIWYNVEKIYR